MTLRVTISVVPFGNEDNEYELHQINISNLGPTGSPKDDDWVYGVEVDKYKTEEYDFTEIHHRPHGALVLASTVLNKVSEVE